MDELIRVYNLMIDQLRLERTRQAEQQFFLDKLIEAAPIALLILDFDERISAVNPRALQLLALPASALIGQFTHAVNHPLLTKLADRSIDKPLTIRGQGADTFQVLQGQFMDRFADVVRIPTPNRQPTNVNELISTVSRLMQPQAEARGVLLRLVLPEVPVMWPLDVVQLEQVLVNVVKNALDVCGPGHTVELLLTARQLQVRNNGPAIPADVAANLFNPFFSTKPDGQGIGLTISRDILLNHGLSFSLQTEPDGWTVFSITR